MCLGQLVNSANSPDSLVPAPAPSARAQPAERVRRACGRRVVGVWSARGRRVVTVELRRSYGGVTVELRWETGVFPSFSPPGFPDFPDEALILCGFCALRALGNLFDGSPGCCQNQPCVNLQGSVMKVQAVRTGPHRADTVEAYQAAVERIISHMKLHLEQTFDLDHIAQMAATSKFHFVRVFQEITGTSPHHFLACLRVQRAKELLLNSETSITDICLEVGYNSLGSFSATFSELVGVSPQQFRTLPKRLTPTQFAKAVWHFLASDRKIVGPAVEGVVEGPHNLHGFTFVGAFTTGVPQGVPLSGTVLLAPGDFRIQWPDAPEFHLLGAFNPLSADLSSIVTSLPIGMVASARVQPPAGGAAAKPCLRLRPLRLTDPPIVLALPALSPWRGMFTD